MFFAILGFAALIIGGYVIWKRRPPKFRGLTETDFTNINQRIVHPALETACQQMLVTVSNLATAGLGHPVDYTTSYTVLGLVQQVNVVDSLPDGARGNIHRDSPTSPTILGLVRHTLSDITFFQHELLHSLTWREPELWARCLPYPGNHWPTIFEPFGTH